VFTCKPETIYSVAYALRNAITSLVPREVFAA